ncbi:Molybdopterin synthase catalytic subunit [Thalassoglobus neptunius]|uniref:Molybdopterin synthase catalytic subunit n=1 Tax=Thalassoglobus neptunius TaxID=1938619 RepID=A0A5C5X6J7_9PLAN|nr:molybdenum cofactor biosynthesis protein MoaE [Thalassoglobus neptunius]TWT58398.1 Molybdopterin synthase catalytic subunit [Thalassoglobus neptunius]
MSFNESDCWIELVDQPIDVSVVQEFVTTRSAGAVVLFLGTVREMTGERQTVALDYQAYPEMAVAKMQEIASEAKEKWPIQKVALIHRTGRLELAEASVVVGVSTPHRGDSFAAGQFLIDELKVRVPVWKRENWVDGTTEWVHPGADSGLPASESPES